MGLAVTIAFSGGMMSAGSAIAADKSIVPQSAFFGGPGGGWNSGGFGNQDVYGKGTSYSPRTKDDPNPQVGSAARSTGLELDTQSAVKEVFRVAYQPATIECPLTKKPIKRTELQNATSLFAWQLIDNFVSAKEKEAASRPLPE